MSLLKLKATGLATILIVIPGIMAACAGGRAVEEPQKLAPSAGEVRPVESKAAALKRRRQAVQSLQMKLAVDAALLPRAEEAVTADGDEEGLIILALAAAPAHGEEVARFLARLISDGSAASPLRAEAARLAAHLNLPPAVAAAQAAILDAKEKGSARFHLLRGLLRGSRLEGDALAFFKSVAQGTASQSDVLKTYAAEALKSAEQAAAYPRRSPQELCATMAETLRRRDARQLVALNSPPTVPIPSVGRRSIPRGGAEVEQMIAFLSGFAARTENWLALYDAALCRGEGYELVLGQQCGLWYVELFRPAPQQGVPEFGTFEPPPYIAPPEKGK